MSSSPVFDDAIRLHRAGRIVEAEQAYRQALVDVPTNPDIVHGLGILLGQRGEFTEATKLITRAIELRPEAAAYYNSLGNIFQQQDLLQEAERQFRAAISISPTLAEAHFNLGNTFRLMGRAEDCLSAYRAALAIRPDHAPSHTQLGIALLAVGRFMEAIPSLAQAVRLKYGFVPAHEAYADALERAGAHEAAEQQYRIVTSLQPARAEAWCNLGRNLLAQRRSADAVVPLEQGLRQSSGLPDIHHYLGLAWLDRGQFEKAIASLEEFLALRPDSSDGWRGLGQARLWTGDFDGANACLERALILDPNNAEAHGALGLAQLTEGNLTRGWAEYEWRWRCASYQEMRTFPAPLWDGRPLESGKTLLLHTEQGFGDAIQFVRYARVLAHTGQAVIVECQQELLRLFRSLNGVPVYARGESLPDFDAHCPLMSVPFRVGTTLETVPAEVPYLHPEPTAKEYWRERLAELPPGLRVGLAWAGNPQRHADHTRSLILEHLSRLRAVQGVSWYSLQKSASVAHAPSTGMVMHDFTGELTDFADTAALAANLDLVITVDTSVAHLAGALAIPTWVLLANGDIWRWMRDRQDSPWYPTLQLFRQTTPGDWGPTMKVVADALRRVATAD